MITFKDRFESFLTILGHFWTDEVGFEGFPVALVTSKCIFRVLWVHLGIYRYWFHDYLVIFDDFRGLERKF
jgi:hypothetical protein